MNSYIHTNVEMYFGDHNVYKEFDDKIQLLYKKRKKNRIEVTDYYLFHLEYMKKLGFWDHPKLDEEILKLRDIIGLIEYEEYLFPFREKEFKNLKKVRNMILKRREKECRIYDVIIGIGCLNILRERMTAGHYAYWMNDINQGSKVFNIHKSLKMY